ncbi:aminotransferase class I/II-fold pyridoxal phosphate-dependent enzyme [Saccharothrix syringae]|uniref:Aminotransferase class I/II-fold pyridoxal phosphate-dependent enzyme n=1 Tax=Saccharothrix syringae TaxID=103733 RepID=A0A5Q0GX23_SACSY|nr:aminotransferase class I/II-fold pyridoxal phosphate-dependent enzyme [Saccharothrix syringae]QFZ17892.1 aminotransferase class I/II-fold pyridoxal phosphate-dependent enzyme [Saccharothrix syringae]
MVSRTAARLADDVPVIAAAHFAAEADRFHPEENPRGYVNLGTAENRLGWDLLEPLLTGTRRRRPEHAHYGLPHGTPELREAVARLLGGPWRTAVDPEDLVVTAGATAALDIAATTACDPGDVILVPAPYYSAFDTDLTGRSGARLVPVPTDPGAGFALDPDAVERALAGLRRDGATVRAVAITSPTNPQGTTHPPAVLRDLLRLAAAHDLDVISDEVYAHSVFGPEPFTGVLDPDVLGGVPEFDPDRLHVVWGFAKDFGLSGLKVGVLRTSGAPRAAARALAYFATVSTDTQALLADLLADRDGVARLLAENRRRLLRSYTHTTARLTEHGIGYLPATAGFSIWLDLRDRLAEPTFTAERRLWRHVLDQGRVNVLPGGAFASPEPGWFRLCHAVDAALVATGVARVAEATAGRKP